MLANDLPDIGFDETPLLRCRRVPVRPWGTDAELQAGRRHVKDISLQPVAACRGHLNRLALLQRGRQLLERGGNQLCACIDWREYEH